MTSLSCVTRNRGDPPAKIIIIIVIIIILSPWGDTEFKRSIFAFRAKIWVIERGILHDNILARFSFISCAQNRRISSPQLLQILLGVCRATPSWRRCLQLSSGRGGWWWPVVNSVDGGTAGRRITFSRLAGRRRGLAAPRYVAPGAQIGSLYTISALCCIVRATRLTPAHPPSSSAILRLRTNVEARRECAPSDSSRSPSACRPTIRRSSRCFIALSLQVS